MTQTVKSVLCHKRYSAIYTTATLSTGGIRQSTRDAYLGHRRIPDHICESTRRLREGMFREAYQLLVSAIVRRHPALHLLSDLCLTSESDMKWFRSLPLSSDLFLLRLGSYSDNYSTELRGSIVNETFIEAVTSISVESPAEMNE